MGRRVMGDARVCVCSFVVEQVLRVCSSDFLDGPQQWQKFCVSKY